MTLTPEQAEANLRLAAAAAETCVAQALEGKARDAAAQLRGQSVRDTGEYADGWRADGQAVVNDVEHASFAPESETLPEQILAELEEPTRVQIDQCVRAAAGWERE